ncbi:MAG: S8 family serine peptidase [Elusimicrobiales bacterium]
MSKVLLAVIFCFLAATRAPSRVSAQEYGAAPAETQSDGAASGKTGGTGDAARKVDRRVEKFIQRKGGEYGLSADSKGNLSRVVKSPDGTSRKTAIDRQSSERIEKLISGLAPGHEDEDMAQALKSFMSAYYSGKSGDKQLCKQGREFFKCNGGKASLTSAGKHAVMDIMCAEFGKSFFKDHYSASGGGQDAGAGEADEPDSDSSGGGGGPDKSRHGKAAAMSSSLSAAAAPQAAAMLFDGGAQARRAGTGLMHFTSQAGAAGIAGARASYGRHPAMTAPAGSLRSGAKPPLSQRKGDFTQALSGTAASLISQSGIDPRIASLRGAVLSRAGGVPIIELPARQAPAAARVSESGFAKIARAAAGAVFRSPMTPALYKAADFARIASHGETRLPEPTSKTKSDITPYRTPEQILNTSALRKYGDGGDRVTIGFIDSGLDQSHPDFAKNRVLDYFDFTGEGKKDHTGHGTAMAGAAAGSGAASGGKYAGIAPNAKFAIFKVVDSNGSSSEERILNALKKVHDMPAETRPKVLNISMQGPHNPSSPISVMVDRLVAEDNVVVVAAAGNNELSQDMHVRQRPIGWPGDSRLALSVTGIGPDGGISPYARRGSISGAGAAFNKPDVTTVYGGIRRPGAPVNFTQRDVERAARGELAMQQNPGEGLYFNGVLLPRSADSDATIREALSNSTLPDGQRARLEKALRRQQADNLLGNDKYAFDSGTSPSAAEMSGIMALAVNRLVKGNIPYTAEQVNALAKESAVPLRGQPADVQGQGLANGDRMKARMEARIKAGVPVGNVAYDISCQLTPDQRRVVASSRNFKMTSLGVLDKRTGHLISTYDDYKLLAAEVGADK